MNRIVGKLQADSPGIAAGTWHTPVPRSIPKGDFQRLRLQLYGAMILLDGLLMALAFLLANLVRYGRPFESYGLNTFAVLFPVYLAIGLNGRAWSIRALTDPQRSADVAVRSLLFAIAVAAVLFFSLKIGEDFSRLVFGIGSLLSVALIAVGRLRFGRLVGRRFDWTFRREVLIVDGIPAEPVGTEIVLDARRERLRPVIDDPAMLDRLGGILDRSERVILSCPPSRRTAWARMLAGANVDVEILTPELEQLGALGLRRHGARATLLVGCGPLGLRQRALKRAFDIMVSTVAVVLFIVPLAIISAAIAVDSRGPVLFRQSRMGRGNRLFTVLKFRTMRVESSDTEGARSTEREDDRVTRVGRFLRRTSLDELPQILNVLRGEMSLVGPRPHALGSTAEDSLFWQIDDRYWDRHAIKPGLTGLAQVRGYRGATERRGDLTDRLQADLEYLDGWHLGRDLAILIRTLGVLVHRNAF